MTLTFQEEGHIYTFDQKVVPSVTQVLEPIIDYSMVPAWRLELAMERGSEVHKMCELHDLGTLGEYNPDYQNYLDAWIDFLQDSGFECDFIETRVFHPLYKYAGMIDRIGRSKKKKTILLDVKTTATILPCVGVQLAAYKEAWDGHIDERWCVQLKPDGTYRRLTLKGKTDFQAFLACLKIHKWKVENNV